MGNARLLVNGAAVLTVLLQTHPSTVLTNSGNVPIYIDTLTTVSSSAFDFLLSPGQSVVWSENVACYAACDPGAMGNLSVSYNVDTFSSAAPSNTALQAPTIQSVAATLDVPSNTMRSVFGPTPQGVAWFIRRISIQLTISCTAYLYIGSIANANIVDGSSAGQLDVADYVVPLYVPPLTLLTLVWQSAIGTGGARIEYTVSAN